MNRENKSASVPERDKQVEEDLWQRHGAEREVWTEPMLIALERGIKGNKWFSLIDKVRSDRTLGAAWEKVRSNAGACGVDGIKVEFFAKDSQRRLLAVKEQLTENTYRPKAIRRVEIPKPGSKEKRPLGIPTVADRVVQSAVKMVIEPIFERDFAPNSYGFYPSFVGLCGVASPFLGVAVTRTRMQGRPAGSREAPAWWPPACRGCRHQRIFRQHSARSPDGAGQRAYQ